MTIGFDGSRAFLKDRTGTENYSYQLLLNLAKIDNRNDYLIYLRPGVTVKTEDWPENFKFKTIKYKRLWTQIGLSFETFKDKLDVLFVPAHTIPIIKKPTLKTVMTVHDLGVEYLPKSHQLKQRLYLNFITNFQLKNATKLIAVSKSTKQDLTNKIKIPAHKIEVVYEGYDDKVFKKQNHDNIVNNIKQFDIEIGKYFLFVGTIQPRKNLERLIESFAEVLKDQKYQDYKLILVGGKGWLSENIYKKPKALGIEDNVKFLGRVDDNTLVSLYNGALSLTFVSLFEGFGLPILEAMACGTPVITSNTSSTPEVAGDAAILVDPQDTQSITKALRYMIENPKIKARLIERGLGRIKKFGWEKCAKETLKVLESIK